MGNFNHAYKDFGEGDSNNEPVFSKTVDSFNFGQKFDLPPSDLGDDTKDKTEAEKAGGGLAGQRMEDAFILSLEEYNLPAGTELEAIAMAGTFEQSLELEIQVNGVVQDTVTSGGTGSEQTKTGHVTVAPGDYVSINVTNLTEDDASFTNPRIVVRIKA